MSDFSKKMYEKSRKHKVAIEKISSTNKQKETQKPRDNSSNKGLQYKADLKSRIKGTSKPSAVSHTNYASLSSNAKYASITPES